MPSPKNNELPSIESLEASIKRVKDERSAKEEEERRAAIHPGRISAELLGGVIVGTFVGYMLDNWFGTLPVFFLICFFLGVAGSAINIYKLARRQDEEEEHVDLSQ